MVVEIAFGRLKAWLRRLNKQNHIFVNSVPNVVAACCTLHNICEIHVNAFDDEWLQDIDAEGIVEASHHPTTTTSGSEDTNQIRNMLMWYFVQNPF